MVKPRATDEYLRLLSLATNVCNLLLTDSRNQEKDRHSNNAFQVIRCWQVRTPLLSDEEPKYKNKAPH